MLVQVRYLQSLPEQVCIYAEEKILWTNTETMHTFEDQFKTIYILCFVFSVDLLPSLFHGHIHTKIDVKEFFECWRKDFRTTLTIPQSFVNYDLLHEEIS